MEFLLHNTTETADTNNTSGTNISINGLGRINYLLLQCIWKWTRCFWKYVENVIATLQTHKSQALMEVNPEFGVILEEDVSNDPFCYMIEVYMYEYIDLEMGTSQSQLSHIATGGRQAFMMYYLRIWRKKTISNPLRKSLIRNGSGPWSNMYLALTLMETLGNKLSS